MKAILISIQPKWCELIASGKKTVEVRKTRPKIDTPFKCYIYCTANKQGMNDLLEIHGTDGKIRKANGKVIGEFVCNDIECFTTDYRANKEQTNRISVQSFLTWVSLELYEYTSPCLYAWHISNLVIYDKPKELSEFHPYCNHADYCTECKNYDFDTKDCRRIKRPPQSWCYVEGGEKQ